MKNPLSGARLAARPLIKMSRNVQTQQESADEGGNFVKTADFLCHSGKNVLSVR
jgi:hypothetical protein